MFDDDSEIVEVNAPVPVNAAQSAMQIRSSFATAIHVQKPRNLKEVEKDFLLEADLAGASFYYGWGVQDKGSGQKKAVEGPSIGLAKSLMRCWGNCAVEMMDVKETPQAYLFTAAFIDLEKGVTMTRPFRQSRSWQVHGKMDSERKEDIRFQIGASKATRNVIRAALPDWLVQKGIERAKRGEMEKLDKYIAKNGIEKARIAIVDELRKHGVSSEMILAKLERPTVGAITKEDMVLLKGDIQALQNGSDSTESLYPYKNADGPKDGDSTKTTNAAGLKQALQKPVAAAQVEKATEPEKNDAPKESAEPEQAEADSAAPETSESQEAPYPDTWKIDRKKTPEGATLPWENHTPMVLAAKSKVENFKMAAIWEARYRLVNVYDKPIPSDETLFEALKSAAQEQLKNSGNGK